ncbi:MAG: hypothetical protein JXE06_04550 [Coriobacteriia bacterium]|nr:hypothetical protein [Coriobacteriia bacterium]MBN2822873.1 hypothetical protein [Coriobacteriia bacterium]
MTSKKWLSVVLGLVLAMSLIVVPGCSTDTETPAEPAVSEEPAVEAFDASQAMIDAAADYFGSEPVPTIAAADLLTIVTSQDPGYQIVSVRSAEDYAKGHIEGAINIPFATIADEENLAKLDPNKKIVVVCYTGHTASEANMFYNMLGYDAITLKFGMSGWTNDEEVYALGALPSGKAAGYPTTTEVPAATGGFDLPAVASDYEDVRAAIIGQAEAYFASGLPFTISAEDVYNIVQSQDPGYQILSVRASDVYAAGHLEGAINAPWTTVADPAVLAQLDPNKKVIVYCYTGHTGGEVTMFLNLMGYEAINMKFGMSGWNSDEAVGGNAGYDPSTVVANPVVQ